MQLILKKTYGIFVTASLLFLAIPFLSADVKSESINPVIIESEKIIPDIAGHPAFRNFTLYEGLNLGALGLSEAAFDHAMKGYQYFLEKGKVINEDIITIIDFSKPSTEKRFFVLDVRKMEVLFQTYVSHGVNSGKLYATSFSNVPESHKSSLGAFITDKTYSGQHGYSLRLRGVEKGINDNAYRRAIVMHSADYASAGYIRLQGYLGRSYGCPALPREFSKPVIDAIKDGSFMFIYAPSKNYEAKSVFL